VYVKPKRGQIDLHDDRYHSLLSELIKTENNFYLLEPNVDLKNYINHTSIVIARPYTSIGFAVASEGISTIYYDPSLDIIDNCPKVDKIKFIQGIKGLENFFIEYIVNNFNQ